VDCSTVCMEVQTVQKNRSPLYGYGTELAVALWQRKGQAHVEGCLCRMAAVRGGKGYAKMKVWGCQIFSGNDYSVLVGRSGNGYRVPCLWRRGGESSQVTQARTGPHRVRAVTRLLLVRALSSAPLRALFFPSPPTTILVFVCSVTGQCPH
jgi:hypothetical protein